METWKTLQNEVLRELYSSQNIVKVIKLGIMKYVLRVARMVKLKNKYETLVLKPQT
jgi:hypothetical protein